VVYRGCVFLVPDYWSIRFFDPSDEAFVWKYMNMHEGTFIDIGAHVGKYAVTMARKLKGQGMVLAFEPHPVNFKYLLVNLRLNELSNVLPFNMACYSNDGCLDLYVAQDSGLHSLVLPRSERKIKVKVCTIDSMVEKLHLKDIRLIKIDVEGAEVEVIKGALKTINRFHPTLIVEVRFSNIAEFNRLMSQLDYNVEVLSVGPDIIYVVSSPRR
jgi:FkbM family methyltransferase